MSEKIKYELGTVGGIYSKILFSQYPGAGTGAITLSDTVDNYKHIIVCAQYSTHNQHLQEGSSRGKGYHRWYCYC